MKHKSSPVLGHETDLKANNLSAEDLRTIFARLNPHVPLSAYDGLLAQFQPALLTDIDDSSSVRLP